jgi:Protein of unknown function (DUF4038)/Putative collagen-binding domain of a collagenase
MPGDVSRARCELRAAQAFAVIAVFATACSHRPSTPTQAPSTTTTDGGATRVGANRDAGTRTDAGRSPANTSSPTQPGTSPSTKDGGSKSSVTDNNTDHSGARPGFPVRLGPAGARYLVDQNGKPFFISGEAAWSLIAQPSLDDARAYLDDRQTKGVNLLLVNLIEHKFAKAAPADAAGDKPFGPKPFTAFNEAYFAHADDILREAAMRNMVVLLAPLYLGYDCEDEGFCQEVRQAAATDMREYGRYVGKRYASFSNLVWIIGGDTDPTPVKSKVLEFIAGLREQDSVHLMTAHNEPESLATNHWSGETWLNVNDIYTYDDALYTMAADAAKQGMPFFLVESAYENEHDATPQTLRAQAYWSVLSGAMGHIFGNCPIWHFSSADKFCGTRAWKSALDSPGIASMAVLHDFFATRSWWDLVPDNQHTILTQGYGTYGQSDYVTAAFSSATGLFVAYLPSSRSVTLDLTHLTGSQVRATWLDPVQGAMHTAGTYTNKQSVMLSPPGRGDWVLYLESPPNG